MKKKVKKDPLQEESARAEKVARLQKLLGLDSLEEGLRQTSQDCLEQPLETVVINGKKVQVVSSKACAYYDEWKYPYMAFIACRDGGFGRKELADLFFVTVDTIQLWMIEHPEFYSCYRKGVDEYDANLVEVSLRQRCTGYDFKEVTRDGRGKVVKTVTKHVPPSVAALGLWLPLRHPSRWQKKEEDQEDPSQKAKGKTLIEESEENTREILRILSRAGVKSSTVIETSDSEADEVHPPQSDT